MTVKSIIRLDFCGFQGIEKNNNYYTKRLSLAYDVRISDAPDLISQPKCAESNHTDSWYATNKHKSTS